jgi:AbiU2
MPLPREIEDTWNFLHKEVTWLHGRWRMYRQLYGTSEARIYALNKVAPTFFGTLQNILLDEVQLALSRLADPARAGRRENLTLETLIEGIDQLGIPYLVTELRKRLEAYWKACEGIVRRRNRRIAHYDLNTLLRAAGESLDAPSRAEIEKALDELRQLMRATYQHFENSYMAYEHFAMFDDADSLLRAVSQALRYRELQQTGQISDDDLILSPIYQELSQTPGSTI